MLKCRIPKSSVCTFFFQCICDFCFPPWIWYLAKLNITGYSDFNIIVQNLFVAFKIAKTCDSPMMSFSPAMEVDFFNAVHLVNNTRGMHITNKQEKTTTPTYGQSIQTSTMTVRLWVIKKDDELGHRLRRSSKGVSVI